MRSLMLALVLWAAQSETERATHPAFQGQGNGTLTVLSVPENIPLEFYTIQCVSADPERAVFSVTRSGKNANPQTLRVGDVYHETGQGISLRIDKGDQSFVVGDTFSFVTYATLEELDELFDDWVNRYVKWIISREERERFERLATPTSRLAFIESFWLRRDTNPETPGNEVREEHRRRFAYAVQSFGAGTPGWATDMGKIYILLGAPHTIERNPAGRTAFERPSEVWTYNNAPNSRLPASFDIGFVDFTATGNFEMVNASNLDVLAPLRTNIGWAMSELEAIGLMRGGGELMDPDTGYRTQIRPTQMVMDQFEFQRNLREVQKIPQLNLPSLREVTARAKFPSLPLSTEAAYFPSGEDLAWVPILVSIPYARLTPQLAEVGRGYRYQADVLVQVIPEPPGSGPELAPLAPIEERLEIRVEESELEPYRASRLLYEAQVSLPPGRYQIETLVRDNPSGALGRASTVLEIPTMNDGGLKVSTLLLVSGAIETPPPPPQGPRPPFQFGRWRLIPVIGGQFAPQSLTAYIQAFGYRMDRQDDRARLRVDFFILRDGRLFSKVAPSYHRPTNPSSVAIMSEISLRELPLGDYTLRARVTDEISTEVVESNADFSVTLED